MDAPPAVQRALRLLGAGFALNFAAAAMAVGPGSAVVVRLTGDLGSAGVYFAVALGSSAAGALLGGRSMDAFGRRKTLVAALLASSAGFALAGAGALAGSVAAFLVGVLVFSLSNGVVGLTRVAAQDMVRPAQRGQAVALVMAIATAGAIVGPLFLVASEPLGAGLGQDPAMLVWFLAAPLPLLGALLVARAPEPRTLTPPAEPVAAAAGPARIPPWPFLAGLSALAAAFAGMTGVMGVTGAALAHAGHGLGAVGATMALHFVGMFAFSRPIGRAADRHGRRAIILAGLALLGLGGALIAWRPEPAALALGLFLIGLGWCGAFLGATVLLTDIIPAERRGRVLGAVDLGAALVSGAVSLGSGALLAGYGLGSVGLLATLIVLAPLVVVGLYAPRDDATMPRAQPA